jgi:hypothetical protein
MCGVGGGRGGLNALLKVSRGTLFWMLYFYKKFGFLISIYHTTLTPASFKTVDSSSAVKSKLPVLSD